MIQQSSCLLQYDAGSPKASRRQAESSKSMEGSAGFTPECVSSINSAVITSMFNVRVRISTVLINQQIILAGLNLSHFIQ
jgi:hypothetical protein